MAQVKLTFAGDSANLERAFDRVGSASKGMADKVDRDSKDVKSSFDRMGEAADGSEGKFMGVADVLDGLGGAFGLPTDKATGLMRAFGDLSGGFAVIQPMIGNLGTMFKTLGTTLITPPLGIVLLIAGLAAAFITAYQKSETFRDIVQAVFRAVQRAVETAVGYFRGFVDFFASIPAAVASIGSGMWDFIKDGAKNVMNAVIWIFETGINLATSPFRAAAGVINWFSSKVGLSVPDILRKDVHIHRLAQGGITNGPTLAPIGDNPGGREAVIPLPPSGPPELGAARQVTVIRLELDGRLLTEVVHDGLLAKQRKSGNLGLVA